METNSYHNLNDLFAQLGLPNDDQQIAAFIHQHQPMPDNLQIWQAAWWSPSQAAFLKQGWIEDADWENTIEQLNTLLHSAP